MFDTNFNYTRLLFIQCRYRIKKNTHFKNVFAIGLFKNDYY